MCIGGVGRAETSRGIAAAILATFGRGPKRHIKVNECASRLLPLSCMNSNTAGVLRLVVLENR